MTEQLPSRTQHAYEVIKRRIIELQLRPGASFTEGELASDLGLSKTPVREALARLRQERLVDATARSGYSVMPVTMKHARDLFQLRALLEAEAAAIAADRGADLATLLTLEELCVTSYKPDDPSSILRFLEANNRFHVMLASLGGNQALAAMLEQVLDQLERLFYVGLALSSRMEEVVHEHRDLLDAVKEGNAQAARQAAAAQTGASQLMVLDAMLSSEELLSANVVGIAVT